MTEVLLHSGQGGMRFGRFFAGRLRVIAAASRILILNIGVPDRNVSLCARFLHSVLHFGWEPKQHKKLDRLSDFFGHVDEKLCFGIR